MKKYFWIVILAGAILLLCLVAALVVVFSPAPKKAIQIAVDKNPTVNIVQNVLAERNTPKIQLNTVSKSQLDYATNYQKKWEPQPSARVIILPHQISEAPAISGAIHAIKSPSVVYLVAPDTGKLCATSICTTDYGFETQAGGLRGSKDYVAKLKTSLPQITVISSIFEPSSSITYLLPYIANEWSGMRVVPILIDPNLTAADSAFLSEALLSALTRDPRAVLVVALESNRDTSAEVAAFHDQTTKDVIRSLADLESDKTDIDHPQILSLALKTARNLKLGQVTVESQISTSTNQTSSYFYSWFAPGTIEKQEAVTILFLGDTMLGRFVAERSRRAGSKDYPFLDIKGTNNSFFHGQDIVVANLEGPVTLRRLAPDKGDVDFLFDPAVAPMLKEVGIDAVSQANNHTLDQGRTGANESRELLTEAGLKVFGDQVRDNAESSLTIIEARGQKVALLGFNITDNPLNKEDAEAALKSAYEQALYVVVFMHWGAEYQSNPNMTQIDLAHWFIDNGVDAVVGAHPHWMQSVEVYNGRPIVYSLGNFIFDQDWSRETNYGLIAGLTLKPEGAEVHLFPIQLKESQPHILQGADRQTRLDRLSNISHESLEKQIKEGSIIINN
jgi:Bacterial capsule synthesis protein PGA_cap